jgi:site-specific recombinase XerD
MELTRSQLDNVLVHAELVMGHVVPSEESKRAYRRAIRELITWWQHRHETQFDKTLIYRYRSYLISRNLAPATINQKLSAIRTLALELADNGTLSSATAAAIARVSGVKSHGIRIGQWLTYLQAEKLIGTPDKTTLKGKRDRALLAVAIGCGLRRLEIANLTVGTVQQREGRWVLVDIRGKHGRIRSVPMATWVKEAIDEWLCAAGIESGCVFRAINKKGCVHGNGISAQTVYEIIKGYGVDTAIDVAPHDLRRSFARMAHVGKSPLEQIQLSLGHASVATTERYIGAKQDIVDAPSDRLGISLHATRPTEQEMEEEFLSLWLPPAVAGIPATGFAYMADGRLETFGMASLRRRPGTSAADSHQEERCRMLAAAVRDSWSTVSGF